MPPRQHPEVSGSLLRLQRAGDTCVRIVSLCLLATSPALALESALVPAQSTGTSNTREKTSDFSQLRKLGARLAAALWKTGLDNIPDTHSKPPGFGEKTAFSQYTGAMATESANAFRRGRYKRSEARKQEDKEAWRKQPNISNPGPDLANFPNSAFTLPQGRVYVEFQPFSYTGSFKNQPGQFNTDFLIRYGATDDIELRLFGNGMTFTGGQYNTWNFSPLAFDIKIQGWLENEEYYLPAMGFEAYLQTEWLGNSVTNNGTQPGFSFNFDQSLPWDIDLEYNFGVVRTLSSERQNIWEFAFQWALQRDFFSDDLALFIHGYFNAANLPRLSNISHATLNGVSAMEDCAVGAGFLWTVNDRVALWAQTSGGLNSYTAPIISYAGLAVAF